MQIDSIKVADYIKGSDENTLFFNTVVKQTKVGETHEKPAELRSISIDNSYYDKTGKSESDFSKELKKAEQIGADLASTVNYVESTTGQDITDKAEDDGFDPLDFEANTVVTVVDQIKMTLAKSGVDISIMGGLSKEEIEAMAPSATAAYSMAAELSDTLSDETKAYLVDNELEPTIENVYNATYSAPKQPEADEAAKEKVSQMLNSMEAQLKAIINEVAGVSNKEGMDIASNLLLENIPVTQKNIKYYSDLNSYVKADDNKINQIIEDSLAEGKQPKDAYVLSGYSLMDQARDIYDEVNAMDASALKDITSRRQLEEVRLMMTVQANFSLLKKGVAIDTSDLADLVDKLRSQEDDMIRSLVGNNNKEETETRVSIYKETMVSLDAIKEAPAALLGTFTRIEDMSLRQVAGEAKTLTDTYKKANDSYEALMTKPRSDMGDSIKKAFRNVDDILEDIGVEVTESSRKAVRILSYNNLAINQESVHDMKAVNEQVQRTFKAMTPAVVTEMIKRGENPLDLKMDDLKNLAEEIKTEVGNGSDEEGFAKFLWKMEHSEGISESDRNAYIGVYRLIHQVEAGDGAAVGALVHAGEDVTLRNLLTAVRSRKHSNREFTIDDNFGATKELNVKDLSITEQVEAAFNINRLKDAKEAMTPAKFSQFENEDAYMSLTADEFASAMENVSVPEDAELENAYRSEKTAEMQQAFTAEKEVYDILAQFDLPNSAIMLEAMTELINNRNAVFEKLFKDNGRSVDSLKEIGSEDPRAALRQVMDDILEKFGEASKTPEEMAEAQEKLADIAEHAMKNMIVEDAAGYLDVRGMKLIRTQMGAMTTMAQKEQTYSIPVMIADEVGNMQLKIVSGKEEKGKVEIALDMKSTGSVKTTFKVDNGSVNADISVENEETLQKVNENIERLVASMEEEINRDSAVNNTENITTTQLYTVARTFIENFTKIFV